MEGGLAAELERAIASHDALAYIIVFESGTPRRVFVMTRDIVVVGRDDGAELKVGDESVSAQHARITNRGQAFEIEDLGSTNGTTIAGNRVERANLRNGDRVILGTTELLFLLDRPSAATVRLPDPAYTPLRRGPATKSGNSGSFAQIVTVPRLAVAARDRDRDSDEISLIDVAQKIARIYDLVRSRARLIGVFAFAGALLGLVSMSVFAPGIKVSSEVKQQAYASLTPGAGQDRWGPADEGSAAFVRGAERALTSADLMHTTLSKLVGKPPSESAVNAGLKNIKIEEIGDHLFRVTYKERASRGAAPADLLSLHLQGFVQGEVDRALRESRGKVTFLRDQLKTVEKDLNVVSQERASFRSLNVDRLPEEASQAQSSRYELESRRAELVGRARQLDLELSAEQAQLKADRPAAQTKFQQSESYRTSVADLNRKLSEAYSRGLKDGHPEVQRLKDEHRRLQTLATQELQATPSVLVRESDPNYQQVQRRVERLRAELSSTRANLGETDRALGKLRNVVADLPRVEQRMTDLNHRQEATKQLHTELFAKMKQAEIQLNLDKVSAESRYDIGPIFEDRPGTLAVLGTRGVLGVFAGLFLAALVLAYQETRKAMSRALAAAAYGQQTTTLVRRGRSAGSRP